MVICQCLLCDGLRIDRPPLPCEGGETSLIRFFFPTLFTQNHLALSKRVGRAQPLLGEGGLGEGGTPPRNGSAKQIEKKKKQRKKNLDFICACINLTDFRAVCFSSLSINPPKFISPPPSPLLTQAPSFFTHSLLSSQSYHSTPSFSSSPSHPTPPPPPPLAAAAALPLLPPNKALSRSFTDDHAWPTPDLVG